MRSVCWLLIGLAALAFTVGTTRVHAPVPRAGGFWRGAVGFLLFAPRMMDSTVHVAARQV